MLFGNVHSVFSFQRLTNVIAEVCLVLFLMIINNYLDDLAALDDEECIFSAVMSLTCFLDILRIPRANKDKGFQMGSATIPQCGG